MAKNQKLREIIRAILEEDYRFQYDNKSFYPNDSMKSTCKNAIDAVTKLKLTGKGEAEGSGLKKAYSIMRGDAMTHGQVKRMKAFFDNNHNSYSQEKAKGKNVYNSGIIQKWNLWGGDAGYKWASNVLNSHKSKNQRSKDNRPKGHKNMMDPTNTRTRTALSYVKNKIKESYIDSKGNLMGFDFKDDDFKKTNEFEQLAKKWDAGGRYVGRIGYEYWFPIEAEEDLNSLGITPEIYSYEVATENPYKGQKFIVFVADPKEWDSQDSD